MRIGILGATGPAGRGLAARVAASGLTAYVGSRDLAKAEATVKALKDRWGERVDRLEPVANADAVAAADIVVLAVNARATIDSAIEHADGLDGKIVVSMASALRKTPDGFVPAVPAEGSLAQAVAVAAPRAKVAVAFQHVPAVAFGALDEVLDGDVVVCGVDADVRREVAGLVARLPDLRPVDGGPLANALAVEALTAVLLTVNARYDTVSGVRITGLKP